RRLEFVLLDEVVLQLDDDALARLRRFLIVLRQRDPEPDHKGANHTGRPQQVDPRPHRFHVASPSIKGGGAEHSVIYPEPPRKQPARGVKSPGKSRAVPPEGHITLSGRSERLYSKGCPVPGYRSSNYCYG